MKILSFLEAHQMIEQTALSSKLTINDKVRTRIIRLSGRLDLWLPPLTKLYGKDSKTTTQLTLKHLTSLHLLEPVFDEIPPSEHLFLLLPGTPPQTSWLVRNHFSNGSKLFSPLFTNWLQHQSTLEAHLLTHLPLTESESKLLACLYDQQSTLVSRDNLAESLWGKNWYNHYSDWTIDTNIHNLRKKLLSHWQLVTVRNRGYILRTHRSKATTIIPPESSAPVKTKPSILPTTGYLNYMNNPSNPRKVYSDLFQALKNENLDLPKDPHYILAINSYSFDNVDALATRYPRANAYFTGFDTRSLKIHQTRINELALNSYQTLFDDIRNSQLQDSSFDLIINDFRLNWNLNHKQDIQSMQEMHRALKNTGTLLLSVVVDARYESDKYGDDQERAPLNLHKPWHFQAQEGLERLCHTVPYYHKLISDSKFTLVKEFDIKEGKAWSLGDIMTDPTTRPSFRRFLLKKK